MISKNIHELCIIYAFCEPNATEVVKNGYGYIVASIGILGGEAPFTAYNAKKSYIENNKDIIKSFNKAINKGLEFVRNNDANTIAKSIYEFFPDMSLNELEISIENYKNQDTWNESTYLKEESFNHLQEIMVAAGELKDYAPYNDLVVNVRD